MARVRVPAYQPYQEQRVTYLSEVVTRKNTCILVVQSCSLARLRHCGRWSRGIRTGEWSGDISGNGKAFRDGHVLLSREDFKSKLVRPSGFA